ncbi:hypothetical protein AMJ86_09415 [bacterium SM23_57]|jgi:hypothetical protein|nr:MAG: hypothetical protein AMJ86_09415 [bacterium SM23_57]
MAKRRNLDRESLEVYLLNLLLAYRPIIQISGLLFLMTSVFALSMSPVVGLITLGIAIFLVMVSFSYQATLYLAKLGAWLGTLRMEND